MLFMYCSICFAKYFVEDIFIYVHQRFWPVIFFSLRKVPLSGFGIRVMPASSSEFSILGKSLRRIGINSFLNGW